MMTSDEIKGALEKIGFDREPKGDSVRISGIFVALIDAKAQGNTTRCVALLNELREIAANSAADRSVSEWLTKELTDTLIDAPADRTARWTHLFRELRSLSAKCPDDPVFNAATSRLDASGM
jgi:hypothetical protein